MTVLGDLGKSVGGQTVESNKGDTQLFQRWRELLAERIEEAISTLGSVPGVRGLVLGGSVGRGEPWPMSDIDILPIVVADSDNEQFCAAVSRNDMREIRRLITENSLLRTDAEIERRKAAFVDWTAGSGRAQGLDVGWLRFTDCEVKEAIHSDIADVAARMTDRRWFHGIDKAYGGRGAADPDGLAQSFASWIMEVRFDPVVVSARAARWWVQLEDARSRAFNAMKSGDQIAATLALRGASGALRLILIEGCWGKRLGSMGREWTRFERMAKAHHAEDLASRIAMLSDARPEDALERMEKAPVWLRERIDLTFVARQEVGEGITFEENARDQLSAFEVHVTRKRPRPWGDWIRIPTPSLESKLAELDDLISTVRRQG
jgi:predicted nucleotidyltransferase